MLTRDLILQASDLPSETVLVPEWGGEVRVRGLTGKERDDYETGIIASRIDQRTGKLTQSMDLANVRARLIVRTVVDENGQRIFTDDDAEALGGKSASALAKVYEVAQKLSGMRAEDLDELAGKSARDPAAVSPSASPVS